MTPTPIFRLNLHPREDINVVEWLIPDVHMGLLAEAPGEQYLFLLPRAVIPHVLFKLDPREIQFSQDGFEQRLVNLLLSRVCA